MLYFSKTQMPAKACVFVLLPKVYLFLGGGGLPVLGEIILPEVWRWMLQDDCRAFFVTCNSFRLTFIWRLRSNRKMVYSYP